VKAGGKELGVRINGLETPWCLDDLLALDGLPIDTLIVPKVNRADDIYAYEQLVRQIEFRGTRKKLSLQPLIETAQGLENAYSIARASARVRSLIFGVGDFMADTGMAFDAALLMPVRSRVVTAAAARVFRRSITSTPSWPISMDWAAAREARALGFAGKWAIHPQQVEPINGAFSPPRKRSKRPAGRSRHMRQRKGPARGDHAGWRLVDEAVLKIARRNLALAQ